MRVEVKEETQGATAANRIFVGPLSVVYPVLARKRIQPLVDPGTVVAVVPYLEPHYSTILRQTFATAIASVPFPVRQRHKYLNPLIHEDHFDALNRIRTGAERVYVDRAAIAIVVPTTTAANVQVDNLAVAGPELAAGRIEPRCRHDELVFEHGQQRVSVRDNICLVGQGGLVPAPESL